MSINDTMDVKVDFDVVLVGAGVSGINTAYHLQQKLPHKSYTLLEGRDQIGGTWDLFKYPGIRSDSDLHTFGFAWNPWNQREAIAGGQSILAYIRESAARFGIDKKIQCQHRMVKASWSSKTETWTLEVLHNGETKRMTCHWLLGATGYYDYEEPLQARIPGLDNFKGQVIHPQFWPTDLDYKNKNIAVIGSGATAITLIPALADKAAHVTMVQRSPSYVLPVPKYDAITDFCKKVLPNSWALSLIRLKYLITPFLFYHFCQWFPQAGRRWVQKVMAGELPPDVPVNPHFTPSYTPWQQRLCVCPSGDFFQALRSHKASVVTGTIGSVTEDAIVMADGAVGSGGGGGPTTLRPDIIVTATGLKLQVFGGARLYVDGDEVAVSTKYMWRGVMLQDTPNMGYMIGYGSTTWTLGADANIHLLARVIQRADSLRRACVVPRVQGPPLADRQVLNLISTYVVAARDILPKAGDRPPWLPKVNYFKDIWASQHGDIRDGLVYY